MNENRLKILRWLPVIGSFGVVLLISMISGFTLSELKDAVYWRKRTVEVMLEAQADEDSLINAQSSVHRFALNGAPNLLVEYKAETNAEIREFARLSDLTKDDADQQKRLKELNAAIQALFDYDNRVIGVYARQGRDAAMNLENESAEVLGTAIKDLEKIKSEEKRLLNLRDAKEQVDFHRATYVLIGGSILAAVLLVIANFFAGKEMARRRLAEAKQRDLIEELRKTLAEIKTLSGLIPICAWCKNIRSDEGFWQSVEHYVACHTDANFTHGMCPACIEKWHSDSKLEGPGN